MLLVAIDTAGRDGSIALCRAEGDSFEAIEVAPLTGRMYSAELIPQLTAALQKNNLDKKNIGAIAVASGPGSFTGLRVGLSTAKAFGVALGVPLVAVSVLEAVAVEGIGNPHPRQTQARVGHPVGHPVIAALDASRRQVFVGEYEFSSGLLAAKGDESLQTLEHFTTWARAQEQTPTVYTPDESLVESLRAELVPVTVVARPRADAIGNIGYAKLRAGLTVSPDELDANYIRRSDAEIFSSPKKA